MAEPLQSCLHQLLALSLFSSTKHSPTPDSHLPWAHLWLPWHHKEHSSFLLLLDPSATFDIVYSSSVWSSFSLGFPLALFYSQIILFFYIFHFWIIIYIYIYLALLYNMWDLSSPCSGSMESTTAPLEKSHPERPFSVSFHWLLFVSLPNRKIGFFWFDSWPICLCVPHTPFCVVSFLPIVSATLFILPSPRSVCLDFSPEL